MSAYHIKGLDAHNPDVEGHPENPAPAKGVPFFTPAQNPSPGTALKNNEDDVTPKLFTPLKIRGVTFPNRIWVAPMCQYSSHDGFATPWHIIHYGDLAQRGPALVMIEATGVQARGRITPECLGLWSDAHMPTLRQIVDFSHSQSSRIGIQLAHAGRKASTTAPWLPSGPTASKEAAGWPEDVIGPSEDPFDTNYPQPRAMTLDDIAEVKRDFNLAVKRAVAVGFDVVELHFAHGYLMSSFFSPASNKRTDKYGGSFENRVRLALEIVEETRATIPETMPLFVRISATDWLEDNAEYTGESWEVEQSAKLAVLLAERGVDVLDVSSGGNHPQQKIKGAPGYQAPFAKRIKREVGDKMLVSSVGNITKGTLAQELISGGKSEDDTPLDLIAAGRSFQKNPGLVWQWADELDVRIRVAAQTSWANGGRARKRVDITKTTVP